MEYSYNINTDFSNGIEFNQLQSEVSVQLPNVIRIDRLGDVINIVFSIALTSSEKIILNQIVSNHNPVSPADDIVIIDATSSIIFNNDVISYQSPHITLADKNKTLTPAEIFNTILVMKITADRTLTLPSYADLVAAYPELSNNYSFSFYVINTTDYNDAKIIISHSNLYGSSVISTPFHKLVTYRSAGTGQFKVVIVNSTYNVYRLS